MQIPGGAGVGAPSPPAGSAGIGTDVTATALREALCRLRALTRRLDAASVWATRCTTGSSHGAAAENR